MDTRLCSSLKINICYIVIIGSRVLFLMFCGTNEPYVDRSTLTQMYTPIPYIYMARRVKNVCEECLLTDIAWEQKGYTYS